MLINTITNPAFTFEEAMPIVFEREGGDEFTQDKSDSGGDTKYGITGRTLGRWLSYKDKTRPRGKATAEQVKALTQKQAEEIYFKWYWANLHWDDVHPSLRFVCFDSSVLHGAGCANILLQQTLNLQAGFLGLPDRIEEDSHVGDKTIEFSHMICDRSPLLGARDLYSIERRSVLFDLADRRAKDRKYFYNLERETKGGWCNRPEMDMAIRHHLTDGELTELTSDWERE